METDQPFSLEEKLTSIQSIVTQIQAGASDFDKQTALFKEGKRLIHECRDYLDVAEVEVQALVDGRLEDFAADE